jgi:predicted PolB exonuclease-like 3'-5' exonuclease
MGLAGQPKGFDGGEVEPYFREGKIKGVADYCETDVVGTYQVWLRYELFRGTLSQDAFQASQRNLADFMKWSGRHNAGDGSAAVVRVTSSSRAYFLSFLH